MGKIQKFESGAVQIKKQLPSDEIFRMDYLDGWEEMSEPQKAYLCSYFDTFPKKIKACIESGIPQSAYKIWINKDKNFTDLMKMIEQIHREELEHLEYVESYTDSKVRGRFLKKGQKSTPSKQQTFIYNEGGSNSGSFSDFEEVIEEAKDQME